MMQYQATTPTTGKPWNFLESCPAKDLELPLPIRKAI